MISVAPLSALTAPRTATGLEMSSVTARDFSEDPQLWTTSILCPSVEVMYHEAIVPPFSGEAVTNVPGYEVRCQYPYGTNGFAVVLGFSPGIPDNDILSRFWFRDSDREDWTSLLSALDGAQNTWIDVGATNYFVCISEVTNRFSHAQYWFGDDLPAKVVEGGGGIEIVSITPSATNVTVRYAVEASAITAGSIVEIDRSWQVRGSSYAWEEWETLWFGPASAGTNVVSFAGFMVDRRSRWRARLRTEVED